MEYFNLLAAIVGYASMIVVIYFLLLRWPIRFLSLVLFHMVAYARAGHWRVLHKLPAMVWREDARHIWDLVECSTLNMTWCGAFRWKFHRRK